jgi:hypothetical protein
LKAIGIERSMASRSIRLSTRSVRAGIKPFCSARGMNTPGDTGPFPPVQRTSASAPTTSVPVRSYCA